MRQALWLLQTGGAYVLEYPLTDVRVSVIIPSYRDWERLQLCLNALDKQTYPKNLFEIIVVNNDPTDLGGTQLTLPENCLVLSEARPGSYAARNRGLLEARGDLYAFTDSDCQPDKDWLTIAVDFFDTNVSVDRVGGKIELFSDSNSYNWLEIYEQFFGFPQDEFVSEHGMAATANMISRKKVFEKIGNFNPELMSGGDGEWGRRAKASGINIVYLEECVVYHPTRATAKEVFGKNRRLAGGQYMLSRKKGALATALLVLKGFLPPLNSLRKIIFNRNESVRRKLKVATVACLLKLLATFEIIRLIFFKGKVKRI